MNRALVSIIALVPSLGAQGVVSPTHFATAEAPTYGSGGLGTTSTPSVLLSIHEELAGSSRMLRAVSVRREGAANFGNYAAATMLVNVDVSTAATTAANPSATFASNHGSNRVRATNFGIVQLPATSFTGPAAEFAYRIPFAQPVSFSGSGPLCLEIQVTSRTHNVTHYFDFAHTLSANPTPQTATWGTGCKAADQSTPAVASPSATPNWPGNAVTLSYTGSALPKSALVSVGIGGNNKVLSGLPLPLELPGTASAPSGACRIYNDFLVFLPALSDSTGRATFNLGLPVNPFFNGLNIYAQFVAPSNGANPYGVVLSNGVQHHLVAPHGVIKIGTVYSDNSLGPTGTVLRNQGYVMRFDA